MPRPMKCRLVGTDPAVTVFKPRGVSSGRLSAVELPRDELEALRLADLENLYHDEAAERMGVSRATFGRLVRSGRAKVADALVNGKMIVFKGGVIAMTTTRRFECEVCGKSFEASWGSGRPEACPACGAGRFHRVDDDRGGWGAGAGRRGGGRGAGGRGGPGGGQGVQARRRRRDGSGRRARAARAARAEKEES
jgi:predicted DNA-binding protein (UPF0251 family)/rubredoxin